MFEKLKKRMQETSDTIQNVSSNVIPDSWLVSPEIKEKRWKICQDCNHLYRPTSNCKLCGCFMQIKTGLAGQKCPINKWLAEPPKNKEEDL